MEPVFVRANFNIDCEWEGLPPVYRVYVNDELFAERTWTWTDCYLDEMLQISASPGLYRVRVETVEPTLARFHTSNYRVDYGPGRWVKKGLLEITHESPGIPA